MKAHRLPVECPLCHHDVALEGDLVTHLVDAHSKVELAEFIHSNTPL